jgi:hypothetical protein
MALPHSVVGVDGVSLVESSTNGPAARGSCLSTTYPACWVGVEPGAVAWEVVWFLAHCWALRNQAPAPGMGVVTSDGFSCCLIFG